MITCSVCNSIIKKPLLHFPNYPLTDVYKKEKGHKFTINQEFYLCDRCGHGQLGNIIEQKILYGSQYSFRTSKGGSHEQNQKLKDFIPDTHFDNIIEIGCNDLYLLKQLKGRGDRLIGIDPLINNPSSDDITIINDFVENVDFSQFEGKSLIITNQFLEHIENPRLLLESLLKNVKYDSVFLFAFPCFDILLNDLRFDQIFNHHLHYFSQHSFDHLLKECGCEIINQSFFPEYWGTMITLFRKSKTPITTPSFTKIFKEHVLNKYQSFLIEMEKTIQKIDSCEDNIYGYGAGLQTAVLNYHLKDKLKKLKCIADDDEQKDNYYLLNLDVPIRYSENIDFENKNVLITAINFYKKIEKKIFLSNPKQIIIPLK